MKENVNAPLVHLIDSTLKESKERFGSLEAFSEVILEKYIASLKKSSRGMEVFSQDTREEVLLAIQDIIRKKMYGFYDINEYREFLTKNNA